MKKLSIFNISIFMICILTLITSINSFYKNNKRIELERSIALQADSIKTITKVIERVNSIQYWKIENCRLTNTLTNESLKLFTLFNKLSNVNIICRLIDTGCSSCNKKQIELLDYLQKVDNLIVLSHASNSRQLRLFSSETKIRTTIYQLEPSQKLFHDDDNTKVVLMYVNKEGGILRAFHLDENTFFLIKNIVSNNGSLKD